MNPDIWPWARDRMTPDDRAEVRAWLNDHPKVPILIGYGRTRGWFARVDGFEGTDRESPILAFRAATALRDVQIVSVLS